MGIGMEEHTAICTALLHIRPRLTQAACGRQSEISLGSTLRQLEMLTRSATYLRHQAHPHHKSTPYMSLTLLPLQCPDI